MREIPIFNNDFNIQIRRANHDDLGSLTIFLQIQSYPPDGPLSISGDVDF